MRRVACRPCSRVVAEQVPWSAGKPHLTGICRCFLARWAKKLPWMEAARSFRSNWDQVYRSVEYVVDYGLAHRRLDQVTALGVDEVRVGQGNHFVALVYQIDTYCRRLLWMGEKRTENLTDTQGVKLSQLLTTNLTTVRAYLLKEDFQRFWSYTYPAWAEKFLHRLCCRTMRSQIKPMKDIAKMLRRHQHLLVNWFRAHKHFNNGIVKGLDLKWNLTVRKAFVFRTFNAIKVASLHELGRLPEPQFTHEFY